MFILHIYVCVCVLCFVFLCCVLCLCIYMKWGVETGSNTPLSKILEYR